MTRDAFLPQVLTLVHLHGHVFQVLYRSEEDAGHFDPEYPPKYPANPVRRDVIEVKMKGHVVFAFRADNPGAWFWYRQHTEDADISHCHIDWHVVAGMVATFIEAPLEIQKKVHPPSYIFESCT